MDGSSPDTKQPQQRKLTKKEFIRMGLKGLFGATLTTVLKPWAQTKTEPFNNAPLKQPAPLLSVSTDKPSLQETKESPAPSDLALFLKNHPLAINLTTEQKQTAEKWVQEQVWHYQRRGLLGLNYTARIKASGKWTNLINEQADKLGLSENSFARFILPGLIFVESGGKEDADNSIAKGLCQLRPATVRKIAEELSLNLGINDTGLFNPDINIALALKYLNSLLKSYPDPSLALWAYHLGEAGLIDAIYSYTVNALPKSTRQEINNRFSDRNQIATAYYTKQFQLNFVNMLTSDVVRDSLRKNRSGDDTEYYVSRVLAGDYLINSQSKT